MAAAMRGIDVPHWVVVHGVDDVASGIYRWPDLSSAATDRGPARRAGADLSGPDARRRRGVRRHRRRAAVLARRPQLPRGPARGRARRGPAAPGCVRPRCQRDRDDVPRLGGAGPAGRAGRPRDAALHVRRRAGVRLACGRRPRRTRRDPAGRGALQGRVIGSRTQERGETPLPHGRPAAVRVDARGISEPGGVAPRRPARGDP